MVGVIKGDSRSLEDPNPKPLRLVRGMRGHFSIAFFFKGLGFVVGLWADGCSCMLVILRVYLPAVSRQPGNIRCGII